MYQKTSFHMYVAVFTVIWWLSFTLRNKVQGIDVANTRYQQCKLRGFDTACSDGANLCDVLLCGRLTVENHYVAYEVRHPRGVEKGTKCGEGAICVNKECIKADQMLPICVGDDIFHNCRPAQPVRRVYTRSKQCIRHGYAGACSGYSNSCNVLHCASSVGPRYIFQKVFPLRGVAIGTACGESKICVGEKCVDVLGEMPIHVGNDTVLECKQKGYSRNRPVKTRHEQCRAHGFQVACEEKESRANSCSRVYCGYEIFPGFYVAYQAISSKGKVLRVIPRAGTKCGEFRTCNAGKCVPTSPEYIPKYFGEDIYRPCHRNRPQESVKCI